ncbi:lipid phosphate phosphatase epsilon 2, chloroplastic-like [Solanum lycopersicum]|uniref:Phosphatidic acid phosphatase type 2/haloperoxidase domain-containing protein n=1 Tax=Solanum lycopersicum TaxID=4081 RepID=A0A3Q7FUU8_SOLLC|nr:lipid phosphate phosphatase epsilon 2, chloroplastic-like [Solanum lycopersicum]
MVVATTLVNGSILVNQLQFRRLDRFSTFKLDICGKFKFKKSISHCTLIPPKMMMDSVENRAAAAAGDEGVSLGGLEKEAVIDGSMNFSSDGIQAFLNSMSKWLMAAVYGMILLWRHDMEALWVTSGGVVNTCLSIALKRILNHERPVSTLRSDPGMPSSHAQSIFYTVAFSIILMIKFFGFNEMTAVTSTLIFAMGSYFSWLRVSQRFHTLNQVAVGAILGFCFSIFWFWLWDAIVMKAFINHYWVRIVAVVGAAGFSVGFLLYVIRNWVIEDLH